jgi:hypothetical protein
MGKQIFSVLLSEVDDLKVAALTSQQGIPDSETQSVSPGLCVQRQSWEGADLRATPETLLGCHSRLTQCFDDFAHLIAPGCAVIFSTLRLPFQMGAMLVRGNVPMLQRLEFFSFGHHNSSRKQLISLDLSVWPPTKGSALGHAHFPGVLTQFHASTMT